MAADVSARVHLVAEKLQQKAQDAQRKGNENAAKALSASVADLRQAMALLAEQRHLLARRRGEGDDEEDDADAHVQQQAARLERVAAMLHKKSEDMKAKGNENAAGALQNSASAVEKGRGLLMEQQQSIFGLLGRWEKLQDVVEERRRRRSSVATSDGEEEEDLETPQGQVIAKVKELMQFRVLLREFFPECRDVEQVREEIEKLLEIEQNCDQLQKKLEESQAETQQVGEMLKQESLALEEARQEMERRQERELQRQEEDAALLEQQREACQAMEELVRESDQEIQRMTKEAAARAEELQSVRVEVDSLATEKERLVRTHAEEIEELHRQLETAMDAMSAKTGEAVETNSEELTSLQEKIATIISEKEELEEAHGKEIEMLKKTHEDELDHIRKQLEETTSVVEQSEAPDSEELQSLKTEIESLVSKNEQLKQKHDNEVEELRQTHAEEIEKLHSELESSSQLASAEDNAAVGVEEVESLRAELEQLAKEKLQILESHCAEVENERANHEDKIEELQNQLESATAALSAKMEETTELQQLKEEVDALVAEKSRLVNDYADEIEKLRVQLVNTGATASGEASSEQEHKEDDVHSDTRNSNEVGDVPVLELEDEEEMLQATDMADEDGANINPAEAIASPKDPAELEATIANLQVKLSDFEERSQVQQQLISTLEQKEGELQEHIELLTEAATRTVDNLTAEHAEETERLLENIAANEHTIEELSTQISQLEETSAQISADKSEVENELARCQAELSACRTELETLTSEYLQLQNDLHAVQDDKDTERGEIDRRLSLLVAEMDEIAIVLQDQVDGDAIRAFEKKEWQSPEITRLCNGISLLLVSLNSVQEQLRTAQLQLDESSNKNGVFEQFLGSIDLRLFAKDAEDEDTVLEQDLDERLALAKTNVLQWLQELDDLRALRAEDSSKIQALEQEITHEKQRVVTVEASARDLQERIESSRDQLAAVQSEKDRLSKAAETLQAQHQSASIQEQQIQAAQQEEVADLQQQLAAVRAEFERYRVRSHTALKKMEKRAELLNGMRKENEELLKQIAESNEQREQAEAARQTSQDRLQEVQRTQEMMQADFDQFAAEKARLIAELEEEKQQLTLGQAQVSQQVQALTLKTQELEIEKTQTEKEAQRAKEAEEAAFQARLRTATSAVQTAKQDLLKVQDALAASKAGNDKRQQLIESLEEKLVQQEADKVVTSETNGHFDRNTSVAAPMSGPIEPSAHLKRDLTTLQKELAALRACEGSLRKQLDDARAELIALQERFATTKAANAEKVFALEQHSSHWKSQLAAATEEVRRLSAIVEEKGSLSTEPPQGSSNSQQLNGVAASVENKLREELEVSSAQIQRLSKEVSELKTEQADSNTEITLLTRSLDSCRQELQEARDQLDHLAPSSSEPEDGEDSTALAKNVKLLAAKEEALKKLRVQVLELQEEVQTLCDDKKALELELEQEELTELQSTRQKLQSEKERAMQLQKREALVAGFDRQVSSIVKELQQRLEDHSTAFREVCEFRDEHRASLFEKDSTSTTTNATATTNKTMYEECLVMRSGVVIKAGASFQLPVICEKRGWRVVWNFSVKEEGADVAFKLGATLASSTDLVEVVASERMNEMSGVFQVQQDSTTLLFEWDNSFSWLNEKTLDYHVSIQEPLTPQAQKVLHSKLELQANAKLLEEGLELLQNESQRRSELSATLERLRECESLKAKHLAGFEARKSEVLSQKTRFQEEMDEQKAAFSAMLREQDEIEDSERGIARVWENAEAEREDVEMTLQLAGNGAQLETLRLEMEERAKAVADELERPAVETEDTSNTGNDISSDPSEDAGQTDIETPVALDASSEKQDDAEPTIEKESANEQ